MGLKHSAASHPLNTKAFGALKAQRPSLSIANDAKLFWLSDILPYDPKEKTKERLIHGLQEYLLLLHAVEESMNALEKNEIAAFDPLVGENACQIRALKNALIFSHHPINSHSLLEKARALKDEVIKLLVEAPQLSSQGKSLKNLLKRIDIKLSYNELYLIRSFLLTKVKVLKAPRDEKPFIKNEFTDTKKIKKMGAVGTMFAESLVKKLRENVSESSTTFIQEIAEEISVPKNMADLFSEKYLVKHRRLNCLPCYWATMVLMLKAMESKLPIVIIARKMAKDQNYKIINELAITFEYTPQGYKKTKTNTLDPKRPALVLLGSSCKNTDELPDEKTWKKELLELSPIDLVLAYAASHRQYPNASDEKLLHGVTDERYHYYKKQASEWGCTAENPSRFFLSHAFCDRLQNIPKHLTIKKAKITRAKALV